MADATANEAKWHLRDEFPAEIRGIQEHLGVLWVACADGSLWMITGAGSPAERVHVRTPAPIRIEAGTAATMENMNG